MIDMKEMNMLLIRKFVLQISRLTQQLQYVPEHAGFWLKSSLLQHIYSEELCRIEEAKQVLLLPVQDESPGNRQ